jgi:glycosyltransferase involved in cell wall biosynthesis
VIEGVRVYRVTSWRHGIHDCGISGALSYVFFAFLKLRRMLRDNHYDMFHYFFSLPTGLLSLYSHGICRRPYILSLRGSDVPGYDTSSLQLNILHELLKPVTRRIWRKAEKVVAISHGLRELALRTRPSQSIGVIYNGIDTDLFKPEPARQRKFKNGVRLLCVARLIERKGLDYLFQAISEMKHPEIKIDLVGTGNNEQKLKMKAKELGIEDRVHFNGYKPPDELARLYNRADIFVLPSLSESLGMVLLEAMGCGLPIIASHVGGIPEIVKNGENGILVNSGSAAEIKKAILCLMDDPALRDHLSRNNISKIRSQFTWEKIAVQYENAYQEAFNQHPS